MRMGNTVTRSKAEPHLDADSWVECFPEGTVQDITALRRLRPRDRKHSERCDWPGQSPVLVRVRAMGSMVDG